MTYSATSPPAWLLETSEKILTLIKPVELVGVLRLRGPIRSRIGLLRSG
jgi:hypothetical protein